MEGLISLLDYCLLLLPHDHDCLLILPCSSMQKITLHDSNKFLKYLLIKKPTENSYIKKSSLFMKISDPPEILKFDNIQPFSVNFSQETAIFERKKDLDKFSR